MRGADKEESQRATRKKNKDTSILVKQKRFSMAKNEIEYLVKAKTDRRPKWTTLDKLINNKKEVKLYDKFLKDVQNRGQATFEQKGNYLLFQKSGVLSELNISPTMDQQFR